jgi:hypothetical protein
MIRMVYDRNYDERYIMFRPTKIENRVVEGTYYIERDFKKKFPSCEPYYLLFDHNKHLDLKQFKVSMV